MDVMIGVDPHKGSHTATMLDRGEHELRRIKVRAGARQASQLLEWADGVGPRTWAVESAGGMGYLLSQQLVAAGETVLNVPATLASRVRVLGTGQSSESDPNDARSVAVAGTHPGGDHDHDDRDDATSIRPAVSPPPPSPSNCDASHPPVASHHRPPDLDCGTSPTTTSPYPPDPHGFDGEGDGIGCES